MKRIFFLLTFMVSLTFAMSAQPIVYSGTASTTLAAAGTTYIYPLRSNGDTIIFDQLGVMTTVITVDSTAGTGNGLISIQYSETAANDNWVTIATNTITVSATGTTRTVTAPFGSRRIRALCTQTTTGGTRYTLDHCYMNYQ